jgi:acyl dehydratase
MNSGSTTSQFVGGLAAFGIGVVAVAVGMVISFFKADRQPSSSVHGSSTVGNIFRWMRPTKVEESA